MSTLPIVRLTGFKIATVANNEHTLTAIQFETDTDIAPLIALTPAQVDSLRDRLREHTTAALEVGWNRE